MAATNKPSRTTIRLSAGSRRLFVAIDYVCLAGLTVHACFIPLFWLLGVPLMAGVNVAAVVVWLMARLVNRRGKLDLAVVMVKLVVAAHATLAVTKLGWESGFHFYLWPLIPFAGLNERISPRVVFIEVAALFVLYSVLFWFTRDIQFSGPSPQMSRSIPFMNVGVVFTAMGMAAVYYRLATTAAEQRLKVQASTDELTGLTNRRRMLEYINEELKRIRRSGRNATLIMGDVDHFKQVNDKYGHQAGDAVLIEVAEQLRASLRSQDFIARWGGEEFLFLLPETDVSGAQIAAEKLREAIRGREIECDGRKLKVTMTYGIAPLDSGAGIDESISHADDALYQGKKAGRDRVVQWQAADATPAGA